MIAADTSTLVAYLAGEKGEDVDALDAALGDSQVCLPPVVLTELLSAPDLPRRVLELLDELPVLEIRDGYWRRPGILRARVLAARHKARLADALIAQSCLDEDVPLISRDADFRWFAKGGGLKLVP